MVDWKRLTDRAEQELHKRGGIRSAQQDTEELRTTARGQGSFSDKLRRTAAAVRQPGSPRRGRKDRRVGARGGAPPPPRSTGR